MYTFAQICVFEWKIQARTLKVLMKSKYQMAVFIQFLFSSAIDQITMMSH